MKKTPKLGSLQRVDLRNAWADEARVFTPWLAKDENISELSDALGIEMSVEGTELSVGKFSADILAIDKKGQPVLIENQLEQTDHTHLGQCLTYAAGLKAKTIIWISKKFREEHRAAIDYLNSSTNDDHSFFGIEIELYRIGNSDLAPRFNVVAKPNNWSREISQKAQRAHEELTSSQKAHKAYWKKLIDVANGRYDALAGRTPFKGNWQTAESKRLGPNLEMLVSASKSRVGLRAELYFSGVSAKAAYDFTRGVIEENGWLDNQDVSWERLDKGQDCRIAIYRHEIEAKTKKGVSSELEWIVDTMKELSDIMDKIARLLKDDPTPIQISNNTIDRD